MRLSLLLIWTGLLLGASIPQGASPPAARATRVADRPVAPLVIGDSIAVRTWCPAAAAASSCDAYDPIGRVRVNAQVGRPFEAGIAIARAKRSAGLVPSRVVIELGTNGPTADADAAAMLAALAGVPHVWFVTCYVAFPAGQAPYGWSAAYRWCPPGLGAGNNAALARAAARQPRRIHLIRWDRVAAGYVTAPASDGVHPDAAGCAVLRRMVHAAVAHVRP